MAFFIHFCCFYSPWNVWEFVEFFFALPFWKGAARNSRCWKRKKGSLCCELLLCRYCCIASMIHGIFLLKLFICIWSFKELKCLRFTIHFQVWWTKRKKKRKNADIEYFALILISWTFSTFVYLFLQRIYNQIKLSLMKHFLSASVWMRFCNRFFFLLIFPKSITVTCVG